MADPRQYSLLQFFFCTSIYYAPCIVFCYTVELESVEQHLSWPWPITRRIRIGKVTVTVTVPAEHTKRLRPAGRIRLHKSLIQYP